MTDRETPLNIPKWQPAYSSGASGTVPPIDYLESGPLGASAHRQQESLSVSAGGHAAGGHAAAGPAGGIDALALTIGMSFIIMILLALLLLSRC